MDQRPDERDGARARAPASLTGKKLRLFVLADPAPGDDGNDDRAATRPARLIAFDDDAASAVVAEPALERTSSGYKGSASDPWLDLQADKRLSGYEAAVPGNVVQGARTRLDGIRRQRMTLAIGFGARAGAAAATAEGALARGFASAAARFKSGWRRYLASLKQPPAVVARDPHMRRLYEQSLLVLAASEDKQYRGASIASPSMPWIWGTLTLDDPDKEISGPYHLVWPRDFYHAATAQQAAGDSAGARRLLDYLWRVQKPDGSWWQNTRVDGSRVLDDRATRRDGAAGRARVVARPPRRGRLGAHPARGGLHRRQRPGHRPGALGEPERLVAEHDRDGDRRPDLRGRRRARARR